MRYYQLNTLTGYEFGESTILPETFFAALKTLGYAGAGFADHHVYAFPSFFAAAQHQDLKGIAGIRVTLASSDTHPLEAVLYVCSEEGYLNLCQILANRKEQYGFDDFKDNASGLALVIDTSDGDFKEALFQKLVSPLLVHYRDIFKENFYLGITLASSQDKDTIGSLYQFATDFSYPTLAFPKVCYLTKKDAYSQALLEAAMAKKQGLELPSEGPSFLLSTKVLDQLYRKEDLERTQALGDAVSFAFYAKRGKPLHFADDDETLKKLTQEGLTKRFPDGIPSDYQERLSYELSVIQGMSFSSYFILVSDYVNYAKSIGIRVGPGRGSAGGSLVSYALFITDLDPLKYHLSFERFLNPKRHTMPDIDVDFEDDRRSEVVTYLKKKYTPEHVTDIITFTQLKPRSALNLIAPVLGFNPLRLKKLTDTISVRADTFEEARNDSFSGYRFQKLLRDPYYQDIVMKAQALLGLPVNTSIHPAGVILNEDPISKTAPCSLKTSGTVEYEFPYMEQMGYLKCDILALSNLTFIKQIEDYVAADKKVLIKAADSLEDPEVYKTLNRLALLDIFQLESKGMKQAILEVKPTSFEDISSLIALYRPGPKNYIPLFARRKSGQDPIHYASPLLEPVLKETYGIMVYQEEVMEVIKAVAGFSAGDADLFRRAISHKDKTVMESYKAQFMAGTKAKGLNEATATAIYADVEKFADYGFNKSHSYCYAMIVYTLLFEKTHYPEEFYDAVLNDISLSSEKFVSLGREVKDLGKQILPPDLQSSRWDRSQWTKTSLILPLNVISGIDETLVKAILQERDKNGTYRSFFELIRRNKDVLTKDNLKTLVSLIDAGALDSLFIGRKALKEQLETYLGFASMGFDESQIPPLAIGDEDLGERLALERNSLGIILSKRMHQIEARPNYRTFLVSDTSALEMSGQVTIESENKDYRLPVTGKEKPEKYSFVLVKADWERTRTYVEPADVILLGKRKVTL